MKLTITNKIITELEVQKLLNNCDDENIKTAINLAFYEGKRLRDILKEIKIPRRTLQYKITKLSLKILKRVITFCQLRTSCIFYLLNQGYTPEYITKVMGFTRTNEVRHMRSINGYIKPKLRFKVLERDKCQCVYCGEGKFLEVDHIIPKSKRGRTILKNLQTLCRKCNIGKGNEKDLNK